MHMTFSRVSLLCIHKIPGKQDVSVLVKHSAIMTATGARVDLFRVDLGVMVQHGLGVQIYTLHFFLLR